MSVSLKVVVLGSQHPGHHCHPPAGPHHEIEIKLGPGMSAQQHGSDGTNTSTTLDTSAAGAAPSSTGGTAQPPNSTITTTITTTTTTTKDTAPGSASTTTTTTIATTQSTSAKSIPTTTTAPGRKQPLAPTKTRHSHRTIPPFSLTLHEEEEDEEDETEEGTFAKKVAKPMKRMAEGRPFRFGSWFEEEGPTNTMLGGGNMKK